VFYDLRKFEIGIKLLHNGIANNNKSVTSADALGTEIPQTNC
jgi:hypothetical protein